MESATFLNNIVVSPPLVKIYRRLGFKKTTSQISSKTQKETDRIITQAAALISLRGSFMRLAINDNINGKISLYGDAIFHSKKLSVFLRDCKEAVLMGATAGNEITEAIKEKSAQGDLQAAVIYDATASEMADAALDWIMDYIKQLIRREKKTLLPRRFSAGYADFDLSNQKIIYQLLALEKIGVRITNECILLPEKSVTAISGLCG
ncbi:MAG TPA: vitamin B12 dependent-methionine synthase activation domain-containing protein [Smithellaceae bacterium]|nr:vitamin B12 dependent-methionine synthase activation domain-containing protein [Smithellaceae bacterium]HQM43530.1 vitamin B12 dependent-methionine synthase activation domain-containing protein [Smithellaceae bacterium]